jgi:hypothetical protein
MRRVLLVALMAVPLAVPSVHAWHAKGHMAVAFVAYQLLTSTIRTRVDALLTRNPSIDEWRNRVASVATAQKNQMIFMLAAVWPDDIKSDPNYTEVNDTVTGPRAGRNIGYRDKLRHKYWHFVDHPFSDDQTPLPTVAAVNAQERIVSFRDTLGSTTASDNVKSYDLVWLEHLVGDVHQPLHCTTRVSAGSVKGDRGGNLVTFNPGCTPCGQATELHGFWDGVVGETKKATVAATFAKTLEEANAVAAAITDVEVWTSESFDLAKAGVYKTPIGAGLGPFTVTSQYRTDTLNVARKQIALGGARLAKLINDHLQ